MRLLHLFSLKEFDDTFKTKKGLDILEFNEDVSNDTKAFILNEITEYIFNTSETMKANGKKLFDYEKDFKYYYYDFLKIGIDLLEDDISWLKFDYLLEDIFLSQHSSIGKVIEYRCYEKPTKNMKQAEQKEHKFYMDKKRQYALYEPHNIEESLSKLWQYAEYKAKE